MRLNNNLQQPSSTLRLSKAGPLQVSKATNDPAKSESDLGAQTTEETRNSVGSAQRLQAQNSVSGTLKSKSVSTVEFASQRLPTNSASAADTTNSNQRATQYNQAQTDTLKRIEDDNAKLTSNSDKAGAEIAREINVQTKDAYDKASQQSLSARREREKAYSDLSNDTQANLKVDTDKLDQKKLLQTNAYAQLQQASGATANPRPNQVVSLFG